MAERRMFSKTIIDSDAFLDMPLSAQSLYFHLSMRADDDGFVNNPKKVQRMIGASDDDLKLLIAKSFLIPFDSGIVVIKHWRIHNYIQKDRYKETVYTEEKQCLEIKENKAYTLNVNQVDTGCIQSGYSLETQVRLGKDRLGEVIEEKKPSSRMARPSLEEVQAYISEKGYHIDAQRFIDYYESNGWKVGRNPMKDWKAAIRSWESRNKADNKPAKPKGQNFEGRNQSDSYYSDLEAKLLNRRRD